MTTVHQQETPTESLQGTLAEQLKSAQRETRHLVGEVAEIAMDLGVLAQKEVQLATVEIKQQLSLAGRALAWGAAAAIFALLVLTFLGWTLLFALAEVFALWAAALITTAVVAVLTAVAAYVAYDRLTKISVVPRRTVKSLQEDAKWAKQQISSSAKSPSSAP